MIISSLMISQDVNRGKKQIILFPLFVFTFLDFHRLHKIRKTTKEWTAVKKVSNPLYLYSNINIKETAYTKNEFGLCSDWTWRKMFLEIHKYLCVRVLQFGRLCSKASPHRPKVESYSCSCPKTVIRFRPISDCQENPQSMAETEQKVFHNIWNLHWWIFPAIQNVWCKFVSVGISE